MIRGFLKNTAWVLNIKNIFILNLTAVCLTRLLNSYNRAQELTGAGVKVCTIFTLTPPTGGYWSARQTRSKNTQQESTFTSWSRTSKSKNSSKETHTGERVVCAVREGAFVVLILFECTLKPRPAFLRVNSKVRFLSVFTVKSISCSMCREEDSPLFINTNVLIEGKSIRF